VDEVYSNLERPLCYYYPGAQIFLPFPPLYSIIMTPMKGLYRWRYHLNAKIRHLSTFRDVYGLFVNGKEIIPQNAKTFDVMAPATDTFLSKVVSATQTDVESAANHAQEAYMSGTWSRLDVRDRSRVLFKIAENLRANIPRLADMEVAQTGRPVREMKAQLARLPEWFEYFGSLIRTHEGNDCCKLSIDLVTNCLSIF
jgi:hypothetical protein